MAPEYGMKPPPAPFSNSGESYIGCFISLISKYEIRYEGVLYFLNINDSTIGLKNVSSYGTEGRRKDGPQVPPSDKVYEYILFRGKDIKNLLVKSPPTSTKAEEQIFSDPAIIQSQCSGVLSSPVASAGGRNLAESVQRQDTPDMTSKALPVGLPSHQSVTKLGPSNQSAATQVAGHPSFYTPMYWQGHSGTSSNSSHSWRQSGPSQPLLMASPLSLQNWIETPETNAPAKEGWTTLSESGIPASSTTASLVNSSRSPSPNSLQISDSLDIPSIFSTKTPMPYSASMTSNRSYTPSFSSPFQDINTIEGQISGKTCSEPRPIYREHSVHHSASSFVDSTSGPLLSPPSLLTPDPFAQPRQHLLSLTQNLSPNRKDMGSLTPTSSSSSVLVPSPASQAPLLPQPTSVQKPQYSASQFTEEFDFAAMNEKFKKDEIWGSLGKAPKEIEAVEDNASPHSLGNRECPELIPNPKPAYKKDDFFDTISCNSLTHGLRNRQNRLSERMRLDNETFGNFQQRPNFGNFQQRPNGGYGGYGAGRGGNFTGPYNWGRGYGYGGRGRGPNFTS